MKNSILTFILLICAAISAITIYKGDKIFLITMFVFALSLAEWIVERINETKNDK